MAYDIIFDIEGALGRKFDNKNAEMFINSVTSASFAENMSHDIEKDFIMFAENRKISKDVIDMVIKTINEFKTGADI